MRFYFGMLDFFARLNDMPAQNLVINGRFDIWQKATSYALTTAFVFGGPDRWMAKQATTAQCTISQAAPSPALPGYKNCLKVLLTNTSTGTIQWMTAFETIDCTPFQGEDVVLSFKCLKGSTWNPTTLSVILYTGTGTDQATSSLGTWTGSATLISTTVNPTSAWVTYELTCTIGATATQIGFTFLATPTGAAVDANSYLMMTGVRLEAGTKASDLDSVPSPFEWARCRRHCQVAAYKVPATTTVSERIDMRAVPSVSGNGAGYTNTGSTADTLVHLQTTAAIQTLTLDSNL
jgi:hypothetical protein